MTFQIDADGARLSFSRNQDESLLIAVGLPAEGRAIAIRLDPAQEEHLIDALLSAKLDQLRAEKSA